MITLKRLFLFTLCISLLNCSKNETQTNIPEQMLEREEEPATLSSAKSLISFTVKKTDNPGLSIDADIQQNGTNLKLFFPFDTDLTQMVSSFEVSDKAKLKLNGTEVSNGSTIDFSTGFNLVVEAEDGSIQQYSITAESNFQELDAAIQQLMQDNNAPSMQLAITKGEKLVYQAQYGYSNLGNTELVTNTSVYRLASVSKVITAISILKMKDDGQLNMDDTVFGTTGILGTDFGTTPYANNIENITVKHLLDHTSGFTNNPNDAFFVNYDWSLSQLIDDVLDNRTLATVPGETYSYSNFGYCMLGRVIEKLSGMTYEAYVKENVLSPLGITTMNISKNGIENKLSNEVEYIAQESFGAYQYNIERIDALGGWTASATDLAKFLVGIDRNGGVTDIVSTGSMADTYFEFGEWGFWGSLPGTSSVVSRLNNDFNFSIVTNTRVIPIQLNQDMQNTLKAQILARSSWPDYNLFELD